MPLCLPPSHFSFYLVCPYVGFPFCMPIYSHIENPRYAIMVAVLSFIFFAFNFRVVSCSFNGNTAITITHHRVHGYQVLLLQTVCLPTRVKRSGQEIQWAEVNVATVVLLVQKHKCQRKRGCGAPSTFPTDTYIIEPYHVTPTKSLAHQYRFIRCI